MEPHLSLRVASFDVGLKNMSLCVLDFDNINYAIKKWCILNIRGKNISDYTEDTINQLRRQQFGCLDYVLIEQQINRNTQMKVISHIIQSYFICEEKIPPSRVLFISPKKRLDGTSFYHGTVVEHVKRQLGLENVYSRKEYKQLSIAIAEKYLETEKNQSWKSFFAALPKKDDYADSFVQAIAWSASTSVMDVD
jgi:hypothetical protein